MKRDLDLSYESILESISDGVFTVDFNWKVTFFNRAAEKITGISKEDAIGKLCSEVLKSSMCENDCALRKRISDIHVLARHFLEKYNRKLGKSVPGFSSGAFSSLMSHNWPGNVRELENVIERAVVLSQGGDITQDLFPPELSTVAEDRSSLLKFDSVKKSAQISFISNALRENNHNIPATARAIGVHKTTLYRIMKKYGIDANKPT